MQLLLDGVIDYLPNPLEVPNYALDTANEEEKVRALPIFNFQTTKTYVAVVAVAFRFRILAWSAILLHDPYVRVCPPCLGIFPCQVLVECCPDAPTLALAFKLEEGKFGQLTYMRIYQVGTAAAHTGQADVLKGRVFCEYLPGLYCDVVCSCGSGCDSEIRSTYVHANLSGGHSCCAHWADLCTERKGFL